MGPGGNSGRTMLSGFLPLSPFVLFLNAQTTPGPATALELEDALHYFAESEQLAPEEAWYCPHCKDHKQAAKALRVWRAPKQLVVHLKRFSWRNVLFRDKLDYEVGGPGRGMDWCCRPSANVFVSRSLSFFFPFPPTFFAGHRSTFPCAASTSSLTCRAATARSATIFTAL